MTTLDMIKLGILASHDAAEEFAEIVIDKWHDDLIPGDLYDVLGLTPREYQAWATGGVSLLTVAQWHKTCHPPLDPSKPWFRISGKPGSEIVGYLDGIADDEAGTVARQGRRSSKRAARQK